MMTKVVTEWEENGYKYTIIATPISTETKPNVSVPEERMMSVFEYFGNRTPDHGTGQRVYDYAKKVGARIESQEVNTVKYTGKVMVYERSFLDYYFNEIDGKELNSAPVDDDDLPF